MTPNASTKRLRRPNRLPLLLLLLAMLVASGCTRSSQIVLMATEDNTPTRLSMTYSRFTGFKETEFTVKDGTTIEVKADIVTESGRLDARIARKDAPDEYLYMGNDIPTSAFIVTLKDPGTYILHVEGKDHTGSYKFDWGE